MIRYVSHLLTFLLGSVFLTGCADHAMDVPGSEAIIYAEHHQIDIKVTDTTPSVVETKLTELVWQFDTDSTHFVLYYSPALHSKAVKVQQALLTQGLNPDRLKLIPDGSLDATFRLHSTHWRARTEPCRAYGVEEAVSRLGCATDANRIRQIRHVDSLAKGSL